MITKETAIEKYNTFREAFANSGINTKDAYTEGFLNGIEAVKEMLVDENIAVYPGNGTPVYKLIWERENKRGYLQRVKRQKSIIISEYMVMKALEKGTIYIEKRPFAKTDIAYLGKFTFETKAEAEAALAKYMKLKS